MLKPKLIIGFGIVIWVAVFFVISLFLGLYERFDAVKLLIVIIAGLISIILTKVAKASNIGELLLCSFCWVAISVILDFLITRRYDYGIFVNHYTWYTYLAIFIAPILSGSLYRKRS